MTDAILKLGGRGYDCNQFLVKDGKENRFDMVDAGIGTDFERVLKEVAAAIDPRRVRRVVLTHEHLDHANGLPLWRNLGAELVASPRAAAKLRVGHDPTSERFGGRIPKLDVDTIAGEGDTVRLGARDYAVLETPGHAPGSACYWDEGEGVLFAGDMLFAEGGIGRFDFPDSDPKQILESILRLGVLPVKVLHSGHGPSSVGDAAARSVRASVRHAQLATGL
ncbi:MAG: hydroxyacylglutathione hydrolase [Thermoplasmata archaeon]|jgi:glyoxylase-like metal-dependent hydrolase (beta-lactamase superfamily II)|nr:hydroxyacylglutathione hydrolase [Thermoplasmata archaeon]